MVGIAFVAAGVGAERTGARERQPVAEAAGSRGVAAQPPEM
ncbi:MAG TPA: hypothetical protein VF109_10555 [Mycobacteriales bacterium]